MQRDEVIATALWLFIPTVVAVYTQDIQHTLIAAGIVAVFMPLQLWVFAKGLWYLIAWFYRLVRRGLAKRKAGKVTGGIVSNPESMADIVYPPAEGVQMLPEAESEEEVF